MRYLKGVLLAGIVTGLVLAGSPCAAAGAVFGVPRASWDLALRLINFGILAFLIFKYGKEPLLNFLQGQREQVRGRFESLEDEAKGFEQQKRDQEGLLQGLDQKVEEIKKYYHEVGESEKQRILEQAESTRQFMLKDAEAAAGRDFEEARKRFRAEVVDLAVALAEDRIRKNIGKKDQTQLVTKYVRQLAGMQAAAAD